MSSKNNSSSSETENACVVCFKNVNIYSIGDCNHPVCYECSTRMRVLCDQTECPICRTHMPKVIFTTDIQKFERLRPKTFDSNFFNRKYGIYFTSPEVQQAFSDLLRHRCPVCKDSQDPFKSFFLLKDHVRQVHEMFYCDLCVSNLKIFSFERRCYNRMQLAIHRRKGDPDDKSHKGHPLCEFCDKRYMDSDELFRHLRKEHLFCQFCDADGQHQFYSVHDDLRQHFQSDHYLCEEGDCQEDWLTSVFRTEIDLKAHIASVHGRLLGKAATKQARTLELEFRLAPRPRSEQQSGSQRSNSRIPAIPTLGQLLNVPEDRNPYDDEGAVGYDTEADGSMQKPIQHINALDPEAFPTLAGSTAPIFGSISARPMTKSSGGGVTIRHYRSSQAPARTDANFPALSSESTSLNRTVRLSVNPPSTSRDISGSNRSVIHSVPVQTPNVSIHVNHRSNGSVRTHISQNSNTLCISQPRPLKDNDFPSLQSNSVQTMQPAQWITPKQKESKKTKVAPAPVLPSRNINSETDFPTLSKANLSKKLDVKKTSSVTVPVTNEEYLSQTKKSDNASSSKGKKTSSVVLPVTNHEVGLKSQKNENEASNKSNTNSSTSSKKSDGKKKTSSVTVPVTNEPTKLLTEKQRKEIDCSSKSVILSPKKSENSKKSVSVAVPVTNNNKSQPDQKSNTANKSSTDSSASTKLESSNKKRSSVIVPLTNEKIVTELKNSKSEKNLPQKLDLNNAKKSDSKKTSSLVVPLTNSWSSEESSKSVEVKSKSKKKRSKNTNNESYLSKKNNFENNNTISASEENNNEEKLNYAKAMTEKNLKSTNNSSNKQSKQSTAAQNGERKRSELKIGTLNSPTLTNGNPFTDDFPALGSKTTAPPGFSNLPMKSPPPGFKQVPPPGFNSVTLNSVARPSNDLTFTNSSGQKYSILPNSMLNTNTIFYLPLNFDQRNKSLIEKFMNAMNSEDMNEFRQVSHSFKEGTYSAHDYYARCKSSLGSQFEIIFPELLVLLPDVQKQKELYEVHKEKTGLKSFKGLDVCPSCGQIVAVGDMKNHYSNHTLENHFPILGSSTPQEVPAAWRK